MEDYQRLLRCSECGANNWSCEKVESDNVLGTMKQHLVCRNCHARFALLFGEQGPEIIMPLDDRTLAKRLLPHLVAEVRKHMGMRH